MKILNQPHIRNIHCIGIGGIGVSGLAEILVRKGYKVTGSDVANNPNIERLKALGIKITLGHQAENVGDAQAIIYTSMIQSNNPELVLSQQKNLPCVSRGEMLAELMEPYNSIAVAGTHGKTTTSGMLIHTLLYAGEDFSYFMGGVLKNLNSPVGFGNGKYFVSESDESDASFLYLKPTTAVIANIDSDHLETYGGSFEQLKAAFLKFLSGIPEHGQALMCIDDPVVLQLLSKVVSKCITFGFHADSDYCAYDYRQSGLRCFFKVKRPNVTEPLEVELNVAGRHNVLNALPSIIIAHQLNIPDAALLNALASFPGVGRRFCYHGEIRAKEGKALLFEDYGHHPNEIKATLEMAKETWPDRRLVLVFQPHRYTRTRDLMGAFAKVLCSADVLVLMEVYAAGEDKIEGVDTSTLSKAVQQLGTSQPVCVSELQQLPTILEDLVKADDIIVFQGAGSIGPYAQTIAKNLS